MLCFSSLNSQEHSRESITQKLNNLMLQVQPSGNYLIHTAINVHNAEAVDRLLGMDAKQKDVPNAQGVTSLELALSRDNPRILELFGVLKPKPQKVKRKKTTKRVKSRVFKRKNNRLASAKPKKGVGKWFDGQENYVSQVSLSTLYFNNLKTPQTCIKLKICRRPSSKTIYHYGQWETKT